MHHIYVVKRNFRIISHPDLTRARLTRINQIPVKIHVLFLRVRFFFSLLPVNAQNVNDIFRTIYSTYPRSTKQSTNGFGWGGTQVLVIQSAILTEIFQDYSISPVEYKYGS